MLFDHRLTSSWFRLNRQRLLSNADYLAVALAFSLPLSTSATSILAVCWVIAVAPTLRIQDVLREIMSVEGGFPLLLILLAVIGVLWGDMAWAARLAGISPFLKLLAIPLLLAQFQRSNRGWSVLYGLLAGTVLLLLVSFTSFILDRSLVTGKVAGIVVKDYISQSGFFVLSIFLLLELSEKAWLEKKTVLMAAQLGLVAAFLLNLGFVATSRTTLLVLPVLLFLFGMQRSWKTALSAGLVCMILFTLAWHWSPYLRRLQSGLSVQVNETELNAGSNRQRLAYWSASIDLIREAPVLGHGTGSVASIFQRYKGSSFDSDVNQAANPHNQSLMIALQLGIMGVVALYGMWFAHVKMFIATGTAAWFGLAVVVQNIVSSLINSHISDFTQGWTYAVLVGVAGGMVKRRSLGPEVFSGCLDFNEPEDETSPS